MKFPGVIRTTLAVALGALSTAHADAAIYWNVFNIEDEHAVTADIVTYASLDDMLHDTNRLQNVSPNSVGFGRNVIDSGSDGHVFWNVFNIEGEHSVTADIVTYATLDDMLHDTNRLQNVSPNSVGFGRNVVGSGSDGKTYWNVFNIEDEHAVTADIVTYASLDDMLHDTNRLQNVSPNSVGFGRNVIDSGSDGKTYWNLFNIEGEHATTADFVTYSSLDDMLHDTNRLQNVSPNSVGFGRNVVGSGAFVTLQSAVPEPASWAMMLGGFGLLGIMFRSRHSIRFRFA